MTSSTRVAIGLLERHENGRYANTPETSFHLDSRTPNYIGAELDYLNTQIYVAWSSLTPVLRTGKPQSGAGAAGNYPRRYSDPTARETFLKGMTDATLVVAETIARKFPWSKCQSYSASSNNGIKRPANRPGFRIAELRSLHEARSAA